MVEPQQISILVLVLIEHFEVRGTLSHFRRNGACWLIVHWPISGCEDFNSEFNVSNLGTLFVFSELCLQLLAESHIFEHLRHLVDLVKPTLNFQLLEHNFLGFHRK